MKIWSIFRQNFHEVENSHKVECTGCYTKTTSRSNFSEKCSLIFTKKLYCNLSPSVEWNSSLRILNVFHKLFYSCYFFGENLYSLNKKQLRNVYQCMTPSISSLILSVLTFKIAVYKHQITYHQEFPLFPFFSFANNFLFFLLSVEVVCL